MQKNFPRQPAFTHKRPAPRKAVGWGKPVTEDVVWTRNIEPREMYLIVYIDRDDQRSEREIELQKLGDIQGTPYLGVMHGGRFKTMRADRVVEVTQLSEGHTPSIRAFPAYATELPVFPLENALYKIPTIAASSRTWTVDLNHYTCTCPEKRIRTAAGYRPGQLGFVCLHMSRAILDNLPANHSWPPELLSFLGDRRRMHIDNLVTA